MADRLWFKPAEGMTIPDPHTRRVCPPEGMWVDAHDEFWQRRAAPPLGDGGGELLENAPAGEADGAEPPEGAAAEG